MGTVLKIKDYYDEQLKNRTDAASKQLEASKMPYQYNISQAPRAFNTQRTEAYSQDMANRRSLRERMANMGFSAGGGASLSAENQRMNAFQRALAGIGLNQQRYVDEQNQAIAQLTAQNQADVTGMTAENRLAMNQALLDQQNRDRDYYLQLLLSGRINLNQFKKYTGMSL